MNPKLRRRIEGFFSGLAELIYRHHLTCLGMTLAIVAALASQIPHAEMDTSAVALLRQNDPIRIQYDAFRDRFNEMRCW